MSKIKFAARAANGLKRKKYVPAKTTFITERGPSVGSIWFDTEGPSRDGLTVQEVTEAIVEYTDGWDYLKDFVRNVASGRYVLVGVTPTLASHIQV
jgi:hypothetical protein